MSRAITVRIRDEEIWLKFKDYVLLKHGKLHTALGEELTEAIKTYLENQSTHSHSRNFSGKILKEAKAIEKEILKHVSPGGSLPQNMLEGMVRRVSGVVDKRAVRNRIEALVAMGFLERDWEISMEGKVFRVIGDEANKFG